MRRGWRLVVVRQSGVRGEEVTNEPQEISLAEYRRFAAKLPRKAKRAPRLDIPRAASDERVGLVPLMKRGWSVQSPDCVKYRLYRINGPDTGLQPTLKDACDKAKELEKGDVPC